MENKEDDLHDKQHRSEDTIDVVESNIEADFSTGGSKDENQNKKVKKNPAKQNTETLDLPDSIIKKILKYIPSSPFERKPVVTKKKFCLPNAANNGCKQHGSISVTCKRLHKLSCERKKSREAKKPSSKPIVDLPVRHLEIPVGFEAYRTTYGDDNPSKWTNCYKSIDKIISSSQWLRHLSIKEYCNTVHTTHLISVSLDTAVKHCSDQLESLQIVSCQISLSKNKSTKGETEEGKVEHEPQAGSSFMYDRPPGSIDWESFSRFAHTCGQNISTLEIDHLHFKNVIKQDNERDAAVEEAGQRIKDTFNEFKKIRTMTLRLTKGRHEDSINITPHVLSSPNIKNNLRTLKISLEDFPDENTSHISEALSSCYKLEELTLQSAKQLSARDLSAISTIPHLRRLGVSGANRLKSSDIVSSFGDSKTKFKNLNSLTLSLCSGIDVNSLEAILGDDDSVGGRDLQNLDIYAIGVCDETFCRIEQEKENTESYLYNLKSLCSKYMAIQITLLGSSSGAMFKFSNLEKLSNGDSIEKRKMWSKLRELRCDTNESSSLNGSGEPRVNIEGNTLPPSPPPEYSNFTVLDSNISCHIKSVPTVVFSSPYSSKVR